MIIFISYKGPKIKNESFTKSLFLWFSVHYEKMIMKINLWLNFTHNFISHKISLLSKTLRTLNLRQQSPIRKRLKKFGHWHSQLLIIRILIIYSFWHMNNIFYYLYILDPILSVAKNGMLNFEGKTKQRRLLKSKMLLID